MLSCDDMLNGAGVLVGRSKMQKAQKWVLRCHIYEFGSASWWFCGRGVVRLEGRSIICELE